MRNTTTKVLALGAGLALVLSLAACGDDDDPAAQPEVDATTAAPSPSAPTIPDITITGIDYGYTLSQPGATTGLNRITFKNDGKDLHMLAIGELKPGKTVTDANAVLKTQDEKDDATVFVNANADEPNVAGEPEILTPGAQTTTYVEFKKAGTYALICFFPVAGAPPAAPDGPPPFHYERGMLNQMVVTEAVGPAAAPPAATLEATVTDGKITMPAGFTGKGLVKVSNPGKKDHLFLVVQITAGKTFEQMVTFVDKYFQGQEKLENIPGQFVGGIAGLKPGESALWEADLPPGSYVAICTESDSEGDGKEHFRLAGEKVAFTVA